MKIKSRIHGPDVLRGFAAVGVVFFHVLYVSGLPVDVIAKAVVGRFDFFVRLFFVISAFSITYAYYGRLNSINDIRWFYLKRFFRIAPLFYFVIALNAAVAVIGSNNLPGLYGYLLSFTFLFPFAPAKVNSIVGGGWSIGVEWMFYAFFPLILSFVRSWRLALFASIPFIFIAVLGHKHFGLYLDGSLRVYGLLFFLSHIQYFLVGIAVFYLFIGTDRTIFHSKQLNGILVVAIVAFIVIYFKFWSKFPEEIILSVGSFFLVYLSSRGLPSYLDNVVTRYLGLISYSIYLMQFPVIGAFKNYGFYSYISSVIKGDLLAYTASSLVTILTVLFISALTFKYVEKPGMKLIMLFSKDK